MTRHLSAPDLQGSYVVAADWLEVLALARPERFSTDADITQPAGILEDRAAPLAAEDDEEEDPDILDPASERGLNAVFDEIAHRERALGANYPFEVVSTPRSIRLAPKPRPRSRLERAGRAIYISCLMMSAVKSGLLDAKGAKLRGDPHIGNLFQICATIAAAGYLAGDAYWFGHPRPDRTTLLTAVERVVEYLESGEARGAAPVGETRYAKDCGVDVVAWRSHHDGFPAKTVMYAQCAAGTNWEGKPVSGKVKRLNTYCSLSPTDHWLPALICPFPLYMEKENAHALWTSAAKAGFYRQIEAEMGVILDRLRVVRWAVEAMRQLQPGTRAAARKLPQLYQWCDEALVAARAA